MNTVSVQTIEVAQIENNEQEVAALSLDELSLIAGGECVVNNL